ncbi:MAG: hypothetical protein IKR73_00360 [Oscillospiraceae bacterium]|nr:hypothetical protein [Oscillospiraceae bacterium]
MKRSVKAAAAIAVVALSALSAGAYTGVYADEADTAAAEQAAEQETLSEEPAADPAAAEPAAEEAAQSALFTKGVYAAYAKGKLQCFVVFTSETEGFTRDTQLGIGLPFAVEQNGSDMMFHFADVEDNTSAHFEQKAPGVLKGTFAESVVGITDCTLTLVEGTDPDDFDAIASAPYADVKGNIFKKGVYIAKTGSDKVYFLFTDEKTGYIVNAKEKSALPFTCVQDGSHIVFDCGTGGKTDAYFKWNGKKLYGTLHINGGAKAQCAYFGKAKNLDPDALIAKYMAG